MRFPIGARVSVDLYCFDTPQVGTVVKPTGRCWVGTPDDLVCIHFDNPMVSERYTCNRTDRGDRGYLTFSNERGSHYNFRLSMIHSAVLKHNLEATI